MNASQLDLVLAGLIDAAGTSCPRTGRRDDAGDPGAGWIGVTVDELEEIELYGLAAVADGDEAPRGDEGRSLAVLLEIDGPPRRRRHRARRPARRAVRGLGRAAPGACARRAPVPDRARRRR